MVKQRAAALANTKQSRDIQQLKLRSTPYFIIILFSIAGAFGRVYMMPDLYWGVHIALLFTQMITLTGIWLLIKKLNAVLDGYIPFDRGPFMRICLQIALTFVAIAPVLIITKLIFQPILPPFVTKQFMMLAILFFVIIIFLFNFAFYSYYFFGNWQQSVEEKSALQVQAAELEREKFNLQYHQLRNQVNPHYLFNMLTSLDGLVHTDPDLASEFIRHMAKVYRYVLQHKENEVVSLDEELHFIEHYMQLLQMRYGNGLQVHFNITEPSRDKGIVMVTLQMLIDNAIKHNIVQDATPLKLVVWDDNDYLAVHNNKQLRNQMETSNKLGLQQLKQLYSYLTLKPVIVEDTAEHYTIKIPLL